MTIGSAIHAFTNSLPGQFIIGGLTVSGIAGFSNSLHNPLLAGVIASIPIGMPSSIFVSDSGIASYTWNLLMMTTVLFFATFVNWYMITKMHASKQLSVSVAMSIWAGLGAIYYYVMKASKKSTN